MGSDFLHPLGYYSVQHWVVPCALIWFSLSSNEVEYLWWSHKAHGSFVNPLLEEVVWRTSLYSLDMSHSNFTKLPSWILIDFLLITKEIAFELMFGGWWIIKEEQGVLIVRNKSSVRRGEVGIVKKRTFSGRQNMRRAGTAGADSGRLIGVRGRRASVMKW